eukprot:CFRG4701T1
MKYYFRNAPLYWFVDLGGRTEENKMSLAEKHSDLGRSVSTPTSNDASGRAHADIDCGSPIAPMLPKGEAKVTTTSLNKPTTHEYILKNWSMRKRSTERELTDMDLASVPTEYIIDDNMSLHRSNEQMRSISDQRSMSLKSDTSGNNTSVRSLNRLYGKACDRTDSSGFDYKLSGATGEDVGGSLSGAQLHMTAGETTNLLQGIKSNDGVKWTRSVARVRKNHHDEDMDIHSNTNEETSVGSVGAAGGMGDGILKFGAKSTEKVAAGAETSYTSDSSNNSKIPWRDSSQSSLSSLGASLKKKSMRMFSTITPRKEISNKDDLGLKVDLNRSPRRTSQVDSQKLISKAVSENSNVVERDSDATTSENGGMRLLDVLPGVTVAKMEEESAAITPWEITSNKQRIISLTNKNTQLEHKPSTKSISSQDSYTSSRVVSGHVSGHTKVGLRDVPTTTVRELSDGYATRENSTTCDSSSGCATASFSNTFSNINTDAANSVTSEGEDVSTLLKTESTVYKHDYSSTVPPSTNLDVYESTILSEVEENKKQELSSSGNDHALLVINTDDSLLVDVGEGVERNLSARRSSSLITAASQLTQHLQSLEHNGIEARSSLRKTSSVSHINLRQAAMDIPIDQIGQESELNRARRQENDKERDAHCSADKDENDGRRATDVRKCENAEVGNSAYGGGEHLAGDVCSRDMNGSDCKSYDNSAFTKDIRGVDANRAEVIKEGLQSPPFTTPNIRYSRNDESLNSNLDVDVTTTPFERNTAQSPEVKFTSSSSLARSSEINASSVNHSVNRGDTQLDDINANPQTMSLSNRPNIPSKKSADGARTNSEVSKVVTVRCLPMKVMTETEKEEITPWAVVSHHTHATTSASVHADTTVTASMKHSARSNDSTASVSQTHGTPTGGVGGAGCALGGGTKHSKDDWSHDKTGKGNSSQSLLKGMMQRQITPESFDVEDTGMSMLQESCPWLSTSMKHFLAYVEKKQHAVDAGWEGTASNVSPPFPQSRRHDTQRTHIHAPRVATSSSGSPTNLHKSSFSASQVGTSPTTTSRTLTNVSALLSQVDSIGGLNAPSYNNRAGSTVTAVGTASTAHSSGGVGSSPSVMIIPKSVDEITPWVSMEPDVVEGGNNLLNVMRLPLSTSRVSSNSSASELSFDHRVGDASSTYVSNISNLSGSQSVNRSSSYNNSGTDGGFRTRIKKYTSKSSFHHSEGTARVRERTVSSFDRFGCLVLNDWCTEASLRSMSPLTNYRARTKPFVFVTMVRESRSRVITLQRQILQETIITMCDTLLNHMVKPSTALVANQISTSTGGSGTGGGDAATLSMCSVSKDTAADAGATQSSIGTNSQSTISNISGKIPQLLRRYSTSQGNVSSSSGGSSAQQQQPHLHPEFTVPDDVESIMTDEICPWDDVLPTSAVPRTPPTTSAIHSKTYSPNRQLSLNVCGDGSDAKANAGSGLKKKRRESIYKDIISASSSKSENRDVAHNGKGGSRKGKSTSVWTRRAMNDSTSTNNMSVDSHHVNSTTSDNNKPSLGANLRRQSYGPNSSTD